jgi:PAS domain S-box-containing protein
MIAPRTFIAALSQRAQAINGEPAAALELGDNLWRELIETVPAAIYTTDAAGRITFYNEAAATLWGCRPELGKSEFCGSWKLYWPDGTPLPHNECPMAMALTQKKPIRGIEAVAERPDGVRVPFIPFPTPLFDVSGALTGAVNLLVDISERKQAEQDGRRLAAIVDSSEDAIVSGDLSGIITSWNPGAERLFGYAAEEMIGKSITLLIPAQLQQEEATILEQVTSGQRVEHFETTRVHKDGTPVTISLTVSPVRNAQGMVVGASKIARDVTERKRAEQALAERNLQLAIAGRAALVGSYVYDVKRGTMQVSQGYATIHGLPEGTTETTISEWRARVHPEDLARAEGLRDQAFADRQNEDNAEYRIVLSTGEVRWIERRGSISYGEDGRPERVVGVNIDITERKQAEEHRNFLNAELDHRVKNVLATVCAIILQSHHDNASTEDFVASINHRIKSLATTHEMLSHSRWHGASLVEIIRSELAPYTAANTDIDGPSIILKTDAAQATAMVLHELATNAAKYGALSKHGGQVSVRWFWLANGTLHHRLAIEWQEIGGPPVSAPSTSGYGTNIIRELIPFELGGTADLTFAPGGLRCRLEIPPQFVSSERSLSTRSTPAALGLGIPASLLARADEVIDSAPYTLLQMLRIAVGTVIAHRPPHRPGRAQFGHPVLTSSV